ncbi:MAG: ATP synthase subunit I [Deltaproteobacteria bacterium]
MNLIVKDPFQRKIEIANWIVLAVIFIISWIFTPFDFYLGVLLGGFISILNFYWMERGLRGIFTNTAAKVKGGVMIKYYIRLILTAIVLYFLIANATVNIIGLLIGLSVVVINIIVTLITTMAKKNLLEEVI